MASAVFFLAPLLVLAGSWYLLTALDADAGDRRRQLRLGAGCFVAAVVLTVVGMALDDRTPAAPQPHGPVGAGV